MATLFIADLHLSVQEPAITAGFLRFLQTEALYADALYILGDLFEFWVGDDDLQSLHTQVADALHALAQQGVPCFFVHGNRDFLLGSQFALAAGMSLLPTESVVDLYGQPTVILHGDTLCTDDVAYQRFRRKVHNRFIQRLFLWLPLAWRQAIAARMRANSATQNQQKSTALMDVNQDAVVACLQRNHCRRMIHGHTHQPAIHTLALHGKKKIRTAQRAVLGAWHTEGSCIRVTRDALELVAFPF